MRIWAIVLFDVFLSPDLDMADNKHDKPEADRRSSPRVRVDHYTVVEFSVGELAHLYQFKIRDLSESGIGVLVKEGSEVLKHLRVGDILNMTYYRGDEMGQPEHLETEIKHITKDDQGKFKSNYVVGLSILKKLDFDP